MYGGVTSHRYELWLQRWLAGGTLAWWGTGWAGAAGLVLQRAGEKAHRKAVQAPGKRAPESGLAQCGEREEQPLGLLFAPSCCDGQQRWQEWRLHFVGGHWLVVGICWG